MKAAGLTDDMCNAIVFYFKPVYGVKNTIAFMYSMLFITQHHRIFQPNSGEHKFQVTEGSDQGRGCFSDIVDLQLAQSIRTPKLYSIYTVYFPVML